MSSTRPAPTNGDESSAARNACQPNRPVCFASATVRSRSLRSKSCAIIRSRNFTSAPCENGASVAPRHPAPIASAGPRARPRPPPRRPPGRRLVTPSPSPRAPPATARSPGPIRRRQLRLKRVVKELGADLAQEHVELSHAVQHRRRRALRRHSASSGTCQRIGVGMRPSDHRPIALSIPLRDRLSRTPPLIDLIAWYWKGRPAPTWP